MIDKNADSIQVMVRVRPLNDREKREGAKSCILISEDSPNTIILDAKPEQKIFKFDFVGGEFISQDDIFKVAGKPITQASLEGYNACIFAYGQTGAGKTFTMQGRGLEKDSEDSIHRGLQPRVFDYLFAITNQETKEQGTEYLIKCSYFEIYNEQIMDLLSNTPTNLIVREDLKKGVYIEGLNEEIVKSSEETIELLRKGARNRHIGSTQMNFESSRSHSCLSMSIESKRGAEGLTNVKASKLHFVDLAGSERQKQTAATGDRLKEATNINKSLTTLGLVINSLVEQAQGKSRHIPYRDSKLTFLLKDSLGGNSRTCMIAAVSAASTQFQETLSTLKFAQRAKMIKNKASINEESSGNIEGLKKEIKRLKEELGQAKNYITALESDTKNLMGSNKKQQQQQNQNDDNVMLIEEDSNNLHLKGKQTPGSSGALAATLTESSVKQIIEMNKRSLDVEIFMKNTLDQVKELDMDLQTELDKKSYYLQIFQSASHYYDQNELRYKMIIYLYEERVKRLLNFNLQMKQKQQQYYSIQQQQQTQNQYDNQLLQDLLNQDQMDLRKQYDNLIQIMQQQKCTMEVYNENVQLKKMMDDMEGESNPTSTAQLMTNLQQYTSIIKELSMKLDESVEDRKLIQEKIERCNLMKIPTPEKLKHFESNISQLKLEHNEKIEKLNYEILTLKQREIEHERTLVMEKKKNGELHQEVNNLREKNIKEAGQYEKRIQEMLSKFDSFEKEKTETSSEYEQEMYKLKVRLIDLESANTSYQTKIQDWERDLIDKDQIIENINDEKEKASQDYGQKMQSLLSEKAHIESQLHTTKANMQIIIEDLNRCKQENMTINSTLQDIQDKENSNLEAIDRLREENKQLQEKIQGFACVKQDEYFQIQNKLEQQLESYSQLEQEKSKLQEEADTLNSTNSYQQQQLEEKQQLIQQFSEKLTTVNKQVKELNEKITKLEGQNTMLTNQVINQNSNQENSPTNLAIKENKELQEQNHELRMQIEFESNQNISLRQQLNQMNNRINDVHTSEEHYRVAYLDLQKQLQQTVLKNKELQQALQMREMEKFELQDELKKANENIQFQTERCVKFKDEAREARNREQQQEKNYKTAKEKLLQLQEMLSQRMDELQKSLAKKGEMESKMITIIKENEQLKSDTQKSGNISEKKVQDLLVSYSRQSKELKDVQTILNAKIEENLALVANTRILQSLAEKCSQGEAEAHVKYKERIELLESEKQALKQRVEKLIEAVVQMETEQVNYVNEIQKFSNMNKQLEQRKKDFEITIENQQKIITEMQKFQKEGMDQEMMIRTSAAKQEMERLQFMIMEKDRKIQELEREKSQFTDTIMNIQNTLYKYNEQFKNLQQLTNIEEENKRLKEEITRLREELRQWQSSGCESVQRTDDQGRIKQGKQKDDELAKLKKRYIEIESKYKEMKASLNIKDSAEKEQFMQEIINLKSSIQKLRKENAEYIEKISELNRQLSLNQSMISLASNNSSSVTSSVVISGTNTQSQIISSTGNNNKMVEEQQQQQELASNIQQNVINLSQFLRTELMQMNRALLRGLPKIQNEMSMSECFQFITAATQKIIEILKEKDRAVNNLQKELEQKDLLYSKLEKEKTQLAFKLGGGQQQQGGGGNQLNPLMTPKHSQVGLMTPASSQFQQGGFGNVGGGYSSHQLQQQQPQQQQQQQMMVPGSTFKVPNPQNSYKYSNTNNPDRITLTELTNVSIAKDREPLYYQQQQQQQQLQQQQQQHTNQHQQFQQQQQQQYPEDLAKRKLRF